MLVITRKTGEQLCVPQCDLVFTILDIQGNKVRVGIAAPAEVKVFRQAVWERIQPPHPRPEAPLSADVPQAP